MALSCWLLSLRTLRDTWLHPSTDPTWEQIQRSGTLRVCMDASYPPFGVQDAEGRFVGYDVDLVEGLAERWGVRSHFTSVHFDGLYDALLAGKCDLLASALPYDETLTEDVLYSPSYFNAGLLIAMPPDSRRVYGPNGLAGVRVGVALGTDAHLEARRLREQARIPLEIVTFPSAEEALESLRQGSVAAALADSVSVYKFARNSGGISYGERFLTDRQYVLALRPDSGYLWKRIADDLARLKREGFLDSLQRRWL